MQSVTVEGYLAADPSILSAQGDGRRRATFRVGETTRFKRADGSSGERTTWFIDTADRLDGDAVEARAEKLKDKIAVLRAQMQALKAMEAQVKASPDGQVSLTDPDARSMATSGRGSGIVGYNVQSVVDAEHHLIVAHDVITTGSDRQQLAVMSGKAKTAMGTDRLEMLADRGYFSGEEIVACEAMGVTPYVPKPLTSGAKADGRFGKQDFV